MTSLEMPSVDWTAGLKRSGRLYLEGIVEASSLNNVLEAHKRHTVSTFGTRTSSRNRFSQDMDEDLQDLKNFIITIHNKLFT